MYYLTLSFFDLSVNSYSIAYVEFWCFCFHLSSFDVSDNFVHDFLPFFLDILNAISNRGLSLFYNACNYTMRSFPCQAIFPYKLPFGKFLLQQQTAL